jgi:hypothetical protein
MDREQEDVQFLWSFALVLVYNVVSVALLYLWAYYGLNGGTGTAIFIALVILYLIGFIYISICIW